MTEIPKPTSGVIDGGIHRYALRVFYEDTDAGGVVYHANYLRWFERARTDLLLLLGVDQRQAIANGLGLYTVSDASLRYLAPARLGDTILLETMAETIRRVFVVMRQIAWRGDTKLCEASIRVGFVSPEGRPRAQPEDWRQAFSRLQPDPKGSE